MISVESYRAGQQLFLHHLPHCFAMELKQQLLTEIHSGHSICLINIQ